MGFWIGAFVVLVIGIVRRIRSRGTEYVLNNRVYCPSTGKSLLRALVVMLLTVFTAFLLTGIFMPGAGMAVIIYLALTPGFFIAAFLLDFFLDTFSFWQNRSGLLKVLLLLLMILIPTFLLTW